MFAHLLKYKYLRISGAIDLNTNTTIIKTLGPMGAVTKTGGGLVSWFGLVNEIVMELFSSRH